MIFGVLVNEKYVVCSNVRGFSVRNYCTNEMIFNEVLIQSNIPELTEIELLDLNESSLYLLCSGKYKSFVCIDIEEVKIRFNSIISLNGPVCHYNEISTLYENGNIIIRFCSIMGESEIHGYRLDDGNEILVDGFDRSDFDGTNLIVQYKNNFINNDGFGLKILSEDGKIKKCINKLSDLFDKLPDDIASKRYWKEKKFLSIPLYFKECKDYIVGNGRLYLRFRDKFDLVVAFNLNNFNVDYYFVFNTGLLNEPIGAMFYSKTRRQLCLADESGNVYGVNDSGSVKKIRCEFVEESVAIDNRPLDDYTVELKNSNIYILYQDNMPKLSSYSYDLFASDARFAGHGYRSMITVGLQIENKNNADERRIIFIDYLKKALDGKSYFISSRKKVGLLEDVISQCESAYKYFNGKLYYLTNEMVAPFWNEEKNALLQEEDRAGIYEFSGIGIEKQKQIVSVREIRKVISYQYIHLIEISMISNEKINIVVGGRNNNDCPINKYIIIVSLKGKNIVFCKKYN